jgi:hypothetical protein
MTCRERGSFWRLGSEGAIESIGPGAREEVKRHSSPVLIAAFVLASLFVVFGGPVLSIFEGEVRDYVGAGMGALIGLILGLVWLFHVGIVLGSSDRVVRARRLILVAATTLAGALASRGALAELEEISS